MKQEGGEPPSEGAGDSPVEDTATCPQKPTMPERFRPSLLHSVADAMGSEFQHEVGQWLYANRDRLRRAHSDGTGTPDLSRRNAWVIWDVDACHAEFAPALRARVLGELDAAVEAFGMTPFDVQPMPMQATMYHHGGFFDWHRDRYADKETQRRIAWVYYLHAEPRRFAGGELEFMDGRIVDPQADTLVLFPVDQLHRVRPVECYTAGVGDARWTINGWLEARP